MSEIIQFIPKAQLTAAENLRGFIDVCRNKLEVFGKDLDWNDTWDVTQWINRRGRRARIALVWTNHDTSKEKPGGIMISPFLDFAKSYMRYQHVFRPTKVVGFRLSALRALERALVQQQGKANVEISDPAIFNLAAQLINDKFKKSSAYRIATQLDMIARFLNANNLVSVGFDWKNPIGRPNDRNRVGKKANKRRAKLLPSQAALDSLAKAFHIATEPKDVIVTSILALLCSAPDRINEVLRLPADCEVFQKRKNGKVAYGLRWWPSKGAEPMVKWIMNSMTEVVKEAIAKVREHTSEARRMAAWYENNPNELYLPKDYKGWRHRKLLNANDISKIIGLSSRNSGYTWVKMNNLEMIRDAFYRFEDVEKVVISMLPRNFPIMDPETGLKYSEALFVIPLNYLSPKATYRCMFHTINIDTVNDQLGSRLKRGVSSIFGRLGFAELDGSPIQITTHQLRHWLNTLAQRGGLSQLDISKWSGRKDIHQNPAYDHMTADELIAKVRSIDNGSMFGPLAEFVAKPPIPREEFLQLKYPTAHTTDIGFCIHDWTMIPCQKHRDCINCTENVCVKGDAKKTARIKQCLCEVEDQLRRAEAARQDDYAGADRWLEHHRLTVERLRGLVSIIEDPNVPIGSIIQLSIDKEFSLIGMAIDYRSQLDDTDAKMLNKMRFLSSKKKLSNLQAALPE